MEQNLQELKDQQAQLRQTIIGYYKESGSSIISLAKRIGIPYTTLRSFMLGGSIRYKNIFKIKEWMSQ